MKYSIKRFSTLDERYFGIISDISHSGIKRTYRKCVGRARKKLADGVLKKAEKHAKLQDLYYDRLQLSTDPSSKTSTKILKDLREQDKKSDFLVKYRIRENGEDPCYDLFGIVSSRAKNEELPKSFEEFKKRPSIISLRSGKNGKHIGLTALHEHAHHTNAIGLDGYIPEKLYFGEMIGLSRRRARDKRINEDLSKLGLKDVLGTYVDGKLVELGERSANRTAYKNLVKSRKKYKVKKNDLAIAKKDYYNSSDENYREDGKRRFYDYLGNWIQIPSKRIKV